MAAEQKPEKSETLWDKTMVAVFGVSMIMAVGNTGMQSVLPAIGREIGMPDWLVVSIFSLSALLWAAMSPYWARRSDQVGRKPMILLGLIGFSVSMALCGVVVSAGLHHWAPIWLIFICFLLARAIFGGFGSASNPASQALIAERSSRENRTEAMALLAGAFGLGTIVGPAVAPLFVLPVVSLAGPMFCAAIFGMAMWAWASRAIPDEPPKPISTAAATEKTSRWASFRGDLSLWRDPRVLPFLIYSFLIASCQTVQGQTLGFMIIDRMNLPPLQAQGFTAIAMMCGAVAGLLGQWGFIRMFKMSPKLLMRMGAALAAIANVVTAIAPTYATIVFAYAVASLGYAFARPGFTAGLSLAVKPEEQARAAGAIAAINGGNAIFAPLIGMVLYQFFRPAPFLLNALLLFAMWAFAIWSVALRRAGEAPATEEDTTVSVLERQEEGGSV